MKDRELAQFFENIPGFCTMRNHPFQSLVGLDKKKLSSDLLKILERTWSSNLISDSDKIRQLVTCVKAADAARLSMWLLEILKDIFPWDRHGVTRSFEMWFSGKEEQ